MLSPPRWSLPLIFLLAVGLFIATYAVDIGPILNTLLWFLGFALLVYMVVAFFKSLKSAKFGDGFNDPPKHSPS
ncbi:MAG: hypothetical protein ACR2NA_11775 [Solirubrobacterales bacterium]